VIVNSTAFNVKRIEQHIRTEPNVQ